MYQFFVDPGAISEKQVVITGKDVNHIKNVLRMKVGEEIAVSNGVDGREYRCGILQMTEDAVICELRFIKEDGVELPSKIYLFQGLPKADKMELIIQKAVELGAYEIIPVATKRTVVKLDAKKEKSKLVRWQAISEAAAKQSKRAVIPQVHSVMSFAHALAYADMLDVRLIPYEMAEGYGKNTQSDRRDKTRAEHRDFYRSGRRICTGGDRAGNGTCHAADHAGQADPADGNSRYDSAFDFDVYTRRTGTESVKNA